MKRFWIGLLGAALVSGCGSDDENGGGEKKNAVNIEDLKGTTWSRACEVTFDGPEHSMHRIEFSEDGKTFKKIFSTKYTDDTCSKVDPEWFGGKEAETLNTYKLGKQISEGVYEIDVTSGFEDETQFLAIKFDAGNISLSVAQDGEDPTIKGEDGTTPETRAKSVFGFKYAKK